MRPTLTIGLTEARAKFDALMAWCEAGGCALLTRRKRPVATLNPFDPNTPVRRRKLKALEREFAVKAEGR